jgi:hypothetical protein
MNLLEDTAARAAYFGVKPLAQFADILPLEWTVVAAGPHVAAARKAAPCYGCTGSDSGVSLFLALL